MSPHVTGRTKLAGLIGWPLDHSLSPVMHNAAYEALHLDWVYVPLPVQDSSDIYRFFGALSVLPFVGVNVTTPYKQIMLDLCDEVAMLAQMAGAVNTVHCADGRTIGYNTDGRGLLEAIETETGFVPEGRRVVLLGAGGAAGAAFVSLVLGKAAHIAVVNRSPERAEELLGRMSAHMRGTESEVVALGDTAREAVDAADLIVNATTVGMNPEDPSPIPAEWIKPTHLVTDMVYRSGSTRLLDAARAAGAQTVDGLAMLVCQAAIAIDIWNPSAQNTTPRDVLKQAALDEIAARGEERGTGD